MVNTLEEIATEPLSPVAVLPRLRTITLVSKKKKKKNLPVTMTRLKK